MRPVILFLIVGGGILAAGGGTDGLAAEDAADVTRVAIAVSGGPVAYTDQFRQEPPAIVIEFRSRNVRAQLEPRVAMNAGIIKEIQSDYYPPGRRALKSLTLTLVQPATYSIAQQANQILIDIETPSGLLPGRMAIGGGLTILGIEARETLISRLQAMGDALQEAAPPAARAPAKPKPVVVTKPVDIPQPVIQPAPVAPGPGRGRAGFWPGMLLGGGATLVAVAGWRRRRKAGVAEGEVPADVLGFAPIAQGASVLEQLVLKAMQRQGKTVASSKAIEGLGRLWVIQTGEVRQGLLVVSEGGFFERKILESFYEVLHQEGLGSGTVYALGAFTAPAQGFATEKAITLIPREEVFKLMEVELNSAALVLDGETLRQQLIKPQIELAAAQAKIQALEQDLATQKKKWEEAEWYLGEERTKRQEVEQQVAQLTQQLAAKDELIDRLAQEADQLKAKSAEVDQRLAAEQEKRAQLEAQIAQLPVRPEQSEAGAPEGQAGAPPPGVAGGVVGEAEVERHEKEQLVHELTRVATETVKEAAVEEAKVSQERRQWPRLDLFRHKGKGVLVRATSNDGEPMNGDARNISAGGLCVELPSSEALADEFEVKLFLPDRTKPIEAIGKLMWKGRGSRRSMGQLGIAFSAINAPDQEAISQFVEQRQPEPASIG